MTSLFEPNDPKKEEQITAEITAEMIYACYPRKIARVAALKAINRVLRAKSITASDLLAYTKKFANSHAGKRGDFTPHPATWFNSGRYLDDQAEWGHVRTAPKIAPRTGEPSLMKDMDGLWAGIVDWSFKDFMAVCQCLKASGLKGEELMQKVRMLNFHARKTRTPEFFAMLEKLAGADQTAAFNKESIGEIPY